MARHQRLETLTLSLAIACLLTAVLMFQTPGSGVYALLFVGAVVVGTVAALVALVASSRADRPAWMRRASGAVMVCFFGLLAWGGYIVTSVPLS